MPRDNSLEYGSRPDKIDSVIVYLKGAKSKSATSLAKEFDAVNKAKKEILQQEAKLKEDLKGMTNELFSAKDAMMTRIMDTASVLITASKMSTRENFDKEKFFEKIYKEFPKLRTKFEEIKNECQILTDVDSNIKVTMKEGIGDTIKNTYAKVKAQVAKIVDNIKSYLTNYDSKLSAWKQELVNNVKVESFNRTIKASNYFLG